MNSQSDTLLFKYFWIIAVLPKKLQFIVLLVLAMYLLWRKKWKIKFDVFSLLILGYASIHMVSIIYNFPRADYENARILAAINTAAVWYIAVVFYLYYKDSDLNITRITKYCFVNNTLMIILVLVARHMGQHTGRWDLPILGNILYRYESPYSRFVGFMEYPTLVVAFIILMTPWAICHLAARLNRLLRLPLIGCYYILSFLPVYYCYSRAGYVLLLAGAVGMLYLYWKEKTEQRHRAVFAILITALLLLGLVPLYRHVSTVASHLLSMREGSNSTRLQIYIETVERFFDHIWIGCGIKSIGKMGYPLGSHSSYLGFWYKAGILGGFLIFTALILQLSSLVKRCVRSRSITGAICILFALLMYGYCIFEDIDGVDWLVCTWFMVMGLLNNKPLSYMYEDSGGTM